MISPNTRRKPAVVPRQVRPKRSYASNLTAPPPPRRRGVPVHRIVGTLLLLVAVVLVPTHLAEHAGTLDPLPGNLEDLLLGFPMAGVLGISGFVALIWR